MLVGLQGSGKTTTAAKLALQLRKQGSRPLLVAADTYRPAAIRQLITLGKQLEIPVFVQRGETDVLKIARSALDFAKSNNRNILIFDTAGRLHTKTGLMDELGKIKHRLTGAVASSVKTAERLKGHGIFVEDLNNVADLPVYVDGADEAVAVDPGFEPEAVRSLLDAAGKRVMTRGGSSQPVKLRGTSATYHW